MLDFKTQYFVWIKIRIDFNFSFKCREDIKWYETEFNREKDSTKHNESITTLNVEGCKIHDFKESQLSERSKSIGKYSIAKL